MRLDGFVVLSSTTAAAFGASALVLATALAEDSVTLTSCYLTTLAGALAVSPQRLSPAGEDFKQHTQPAEPLHAILAGACLLDHASALRELLATESGCPGRAA